MKVRRTLSIPRLLVLSLIVGLAAACAPTPVVAPTLQPVPTKVSTKVPNTVAPTLAPTLAPTQKPISTLAPTAKPTLAPTQAPTKAAPTAVPTLKPQATSVPLPLGQAGILGSLSVAPSAISQLTSLGSDKPKSGNVYMVVTMTLQNLSKTAVISVDPTKLSAIDLASGKSIFALSLKSLKNQLLAQSLKAGAKVSAVMAFEVLAQDSKSLMLVFNDGKSQVRWNIGK